ncbi:MAG: endonuclease MutS2 [Candidatus Borkfalkiaceae bacterium]|nr:endonuclease MutS2 [Christensenellaceae bacterium]
MIDERVLYVLEYDKILKFCAENAVLDLSKQTLKNQKPTTDLSTAEFLLKKTSEAFKLLYTYGVSGIPFFDEITDELDRSERGSTLSPAELLRVARLLCSSRIVYDSIAEVTDDEITALRAISESIFFDRYLESEIKEKILSDDAISDNASEKLAAIRRKIKRLNEQIREKLIYYVKSQSKYLQDGIVTMRGDRYVVPVKSEFKGQIKGLIHDQSASGSTLFVEPVEVLEMNNDLKTAAIEEKIEIEKILSELTQKVGVIAERLKNNVNCLTELDCAYAKAIYAYNTHGKMPILNENGYINVIGGKHPLIDEKKVVPVSLSLGSGYNYLLITGPNTGGKTVTMKLAGLFTLMASSGFYIPTTAESNISVFDKIFCDIGDEQSIEQSLSTFSSHMKNVIDVTNRVDQKSLVLLDEIGAGTDPEEGSAIARAILEYLVEKGSYGIITTHYSALKEYAFSDNRIMNASMDFDETTFAPLYRLNIGIAGSSNAIKIAAGLGLKPELISSAKELLSENKVSFEKVLEEAQKSRKAAEKQVEEYEAINKEKKFELDALLSERAKFDKEREKFFLNAKIESRRIINESLEEADDYIRQIKELFDKEELNGGDLIKARTLRNKLEEQKYKLEAESDVNFSDKPFDCSKIKVGDRVFVNSMNANGIVVVINKKKQTCEINVGEIRVSSKFSDLYQPRKEKKEKNTAVSVRIDRANFTAPETQINVIGKNTDEALKDVEEFLDRAVVNNLNEVKIIHGVGLKILSKAIHEFLRKDPRVAEFRFGKYGEGEHGVTFVTLK